MAASAPESRRPRYREKQRHCFMIRMTRTQQRELERRRPKDVSKNHWILCQLGLAEIDNPPSRNSRLDAED